MAASAPSPAPDASTEDRIAAAMGFGDESAPAATGDATAEDEETPEAEPTEEAPESEEPAEGEGEEEAAEEAEAEESDLSSLTYPVTIDGEVREIPLAELAKGYLQERDYTQKTQALAEQRRAFEGERTGWAQARQTVAQQLDQVMPLLIEKIQAGRPTPQRLQELRATDPGEYARVMLDMQQEDNLLRNAANQRMALIQQEERERHAAAEAAKPQARAKLMTTVPAFRETDREKSADGFNYATYDAVGAYVLSKGVSQEQWGAITDPALVEIAYWAMVGEKAARTAKKAQPKLGALPKPIRPGARKAAPSPREAEAAQARALRERVRKSGSVSDAAAAIRRIPGLGIA